MVMSLIAFLLCLKKYIFTFNFLGKRRESDKCAERNNVGSVVFYRKCGSSDCLRKRQLFSAACI